MMNGGLCPACFSLTPLDTAAAGCGDHDAFATAAQQLRRQYDEGTCSTLPLPWRRPRLGLSLTVLIILASREHAQSPGALVASCYIMRSRVMCSRANQRRMRRNWRVMQFVELCCFVASAVSMFYKYSAGFEYAIASRSFGCPHFQLQ